MRPYLGAVATAVGLMLSSSGCLDPFRTRMPTVESGNVRGERLIYELDHDPFPDPNIGPETFTRPREFTTNRTEPRRARDRKLLRGEAAQGIPSATAPLPARPAVVAPPYDSRTGAVIP